MSTATALRSEIDAQTAGAILEDTDLVTGGGGEQEKVLRHSSHCD